MASHTGYVSRHTARFADCCGELPIFSNSTNKNVLCVNTEGTASKAEICESISHQFAQKKNLLVFFKLCVGQKKMRFIQE